MRCGRQRSGADPSRRRNGSGPSAEGRRVDDEASTCHSRACLIRQNGAEVDVGTTDRPPEAAGTCSRESGTGRSSPARSSTSPSPSRRSPRRMPRWTSAAPSRPSCSPDLDSDAGPHPYGNVQPDLSVARAQLSGTAARRALGDGIRGVLRPRRLGVQVDGAAAMGQRTLMSFLAPSTPAVTSGTSCFARARRGQWPTGA
jgi:hypothetical protein